MEKTFDSTQEKSFGIFMLKALFLLLAGICLVLATSQLSEAKPPKSTLDPPASLKANSASSHQSNLQWQYNSNKIDGFSIERSTSQGAGFSEVATTGSNATSYQDSGLTDGKTYYYRMRAFKKAGRDTTYSVYSNSTSATTLATANPVNPGSFSFGAASHVANEDAGTVAVTVNRLGGSDGVATVDWKTGGNSATAGADFGDVAWTTLTFADGETSKTATVAIIDDTTVESDEAFNVQLANPTGGAALDTITTSTITIKDNDVAATPVPGAFEFSVSAVSVNESAGSVAVTINRVGGSDGVATVDWRTKGVSATYGDDYGDFNWTTLTFADGEASKTQNIAIVDDTTVESDETFEVLLGNPTGGATLGATTTSTVTIKDNDTASTSGPAPAPVLNSVDVSGTDFVLNWSQPSSTYGAPDGGYDVFIDGVDQNNHGSGTSFTVTGLPAGTHSFLVEARFTEVSEFPHSAELSATSTTSSDSSATNSPPYTGGPLPVFPGAQGFGTETAAGRGGKIIKVTNLNDSGTGSLRAAVEASGARIVVFETSGTITLSKDLNINNPYITIAGQSAPSPGITLRRAGLIIRTHDVLVQHLRIRVGDDPNGPDPSTRDAIDFNGYSDEVYNAVVDHISASWAIDEIGSTYRNVHDVTISNSILSEPLNDSLHSKGLHGYGFIIGDNTRKVGLVGNLLAHNQQRNPAVKGGNSAAIVNNVMYNGGFNPWIYVINDYGNGPSLVSAVGNVFIDGADTPGNAKVIRVYNNCASGTSIYMSDNRASGTMLSYDTSFNPAVSTPPVWDPSISVKSSGTVESSVLAHSGARPQDRDAVDERVVSEVQSRSGYIIDTPGQVGGWPNLARNTRTFPTPANPNGDDDGDGYTNIEEVLQQMAASLE